MSLKAVSWALEQDVSDALAKLVLIGLCDAHNGKSNRCFPSKSELRKAASCSDRTVDRKLEWLRENGWIEIATRYAESGRQTSNEYTINFDAVEGVTVTGRGVTSDVGEGVTADAPYEQEERTGNTTLLREGANDLYSGLSEKLCQAAGITDETKSIGLINLSEPLNWLHNGCSLELDILPTIQNIGAKGGTVKTWKYYTEAIFEAKATRLRPAPDVQSKANQSSKPTQQSYADRIAKLEAAR